jgi:hypothetical protein
MRVLRVMNVPVRLCFSPDLPSKMSGLGIYSRLKCMLLTALVTKGTNQ